MSRARLRRLRYRFTTDGWASSAEVRARLIEREREQPVIRFAPISDPPLAGRLEGYFHLDGDAQLASGEAPKMRCFTFAIPDRCELAELIDPDDSPVEAADEISLSACAN